VRRITKARSAKSTKEARRGGFLRGLRAPHPVAGSRDRGLAAAPDMHYELAAEILFLIETLEG
jgi:hypothetical protein